MSRGGFDACVPAVPALVVEGLSAGDLDLAGLARDPAESDSTEDSTSDMLRQPQGVMGFPARVMWHSRHQAVGLAWFRV